MLFLELTSNVSVKEAVPTQTRMIAARKKTDPVATMTLLTKKNSEDIILDFVLQARETGGEIVTE